MLEDDGKWQCEAENAKGYIENGRPIQLVVLGMYYKLCKLENEKKKSKKKLNTHQFRTFIILYLRMQALHVQQNVQNIVNVIIIQFKTSTSMYVCTYIIWNEIVSMFIVLNGYVYECRRHIQGRFLYISE